MTVPEGWGGLGSGLCIRREFYPGAMPQMLELPVNVKPGIQQAVTIPVPLSSSSTWELWKCFFFLFFFSREQFFS